MSEHDSFKESLFNLDDRYLIHIQPCDTGNDYTIYSAHTGELMDGGQIEAHMTNDLSMAMAIIMAHDLPEFPPEPADPALLEAIHEGALPDALESAFIHDSTDGYAIYQVKHTPNNHPLFFASYAEAQLDNQPIERSRYDLLYVSPLTQDPRLKLVDHLNQLYEKFNIDQPEDFMGHSLSVSDVIGIRHNGKLSFMYVDSFGFKPLQNFMQVPECKASLHEQLNAAAAAQIKTMKLTQPHAEMER